MLTGGLPERGRSIQDRSNLPWPSTEYPCTTETSTTSRKCKDLDRMWAVCQVLVVENSVEREEPQRSAQKSGVEGSGLD